MKKSLIINNILIFAILVYWYIITKISNYNEFYFNRNSLLSLIGVFISIYLPLIVINLNVFNLSYKKEIYKNKKCLYLWVILYSIVILVVIVNQFIYTIHSNLGFFVSIILVLSIFIVKLWNISLKNFNWDISFRMLALILIIFILWFIPKNLILNTWDKTTLKIIYYEGPLRFLGGLLKTSIYPAFYEEFLFRGLLISGLLALKIEDCKVNLVQSILFGITHIFANSHIFTNQTGTIIFISSLSICSIQFLTGYILGKVFLKTKSISSCVILHTLFDTFYNIV